MKCLFRIFLAMCGYYRDQFSTLLAVPWPTLVIPPCAEHLQHISICIFENWPSAGRNTKTQKCSIGELRTPLEHRTGKKRTERMLCSRGAYRWSCSLPSLCCGSSGSLFVWTSRGYYRRRRKKRYVQLYRYIHARMSGACLLTFISQRTEPYLVS